MKNAIYYTITPHDLAGHLFRVTVAVHSPDPDGQRFALPAWIPGSYMIREFARNIVQIRATASQEDILPEKLDKHTWRTPPGSAPLILAYDVYAWDLSVRGAHLDQTHGFFNGTSVFLRVIGQEHLPHIVEIKKPADPAYANWQVATSLPELDAARHEFGTYIASGYDELIDHPVEMGTFALAVFDACGIRHEIAITGRVPNLDMDRVVSDLTRICETQICFFEPETEKPPMDRYVFLVMAIGNGYGGLEHRASTALLCARSDLPAKMPSSEALTPMSEGYQNFLGLCSHEYFHTWHVKRIRPAVFAPYDLQSETYTRLLWLFEGFTSYYDDLMVVRSGLFDVSTYLQRIARTINNVKRAAGRKKQSIAEASFDAWIKFYRQDENATNAQINYYIKGSLVALALDLTIRIRTNGEKSLDDGMRLLWQRYGHNHELEAREKGISDEKAEMIFEEATGLDLKDFFRRYVHGTDELQLGHLFEHFGVSENQPAKRQKASLNIRVVHAAGECKIANVYEGGAAHAAGLSAGDLLVAVDGIRVPGESPSTSLDNLLSRYRVGDPVTIHAFRRDELMVFKVTLAADDTPLYTLSLSADQTPPTIEARRSWLKWEDV
ncbi:PDZ domain-containing protein [Oxalobacter vibrioformis]|uniref:PDZ domain-containing protein n=1 Tax=Oxalobacter vibrioformis TaxID=933080 RepID=A0A9E9LYU1_9BURK|nr:PDZ domain-containing protein [Oxalobacter vibrioformis]WAW11252.1 PDZ domain-containing protein [Oxalobacter vibrioformis]